MTKSNTKKKICFFLFLVYAFYLLLLLFEYGSLFYFDLLFKAPFDEVEFDVTIKNLQLENSLLTFR